MTHEQTVDEPATAEAPTHHIEEAVRVWLELDQADNRRHRWVIDPTTLDGYDLESDYENGPSTGGCDCGGTDECQQLAADASRLPLPTAVELALLLVDAIIEQGGEQAAQLTSELRALLSRSSTRLRVLLRRSTARLRALLPRHAAR